MHIQTFLAVVLALSSAGAAADKQEQFLAAARKGDVAAVKALLAQGVDVNTKSPYGVTALAFAADRGHLEVVKVLLAHRADVNAKDRFYKFTPLGWAVMRGRADIAKALIQAGAKDFEDSLVNAAIRGDAALVRAILEACKVKPEGLNRALQAAPTDSKVVIELLRKAGAKPIVQTGVRVDRAILASYAGTYRSDSGNEIKIVLEDGKLLASLADNQKKSLIAADQSTFKVTGTDGLTLNFRRRDNNVFNLALKLGKDEVVYRRLDASVQPGTPTVTQEDAPGRVIAAQNWPQFRGAGA